MVGFIVFEEVGFLEYFVSCCKFFKCFIDDNGNYNILFYYFNDVYVYFDEFFFLGIDCICLERGCYGGYVCIKYVFGEFCFLYLDLLFLNVGDEF